MAEDAKGATGEVAGDVAGDRGTVKPIPPEKEAQVAKGGPATEQPRGPDGKFLPIGASADGDAIPDKDYPIAHLEGMPDERKTAPQPKAQRFQRGIGRVLEKAPRPDDGTTAGLVEPGSAADKTAVDPNAPPAVVPKPGQEGQPEQPAATKYKFKVGKNEKGEPVYEEFDSEDKFHDNVRTLRGMYRSETTRRQSAEQTARANEQAARDWKALAEAYESGEKVPQRRAAGNGQGAPNANERAAAGEAAAETGAPEDAVVRKIDWNAYRQVRADARAAEQRGEIPAGESETLVHAYLVRETAKLVRADLDAGVEKRFADVTAPAREREALLGHAKDLTDAVDSLHRDMVYADGTPYYPELSDPEVRTELGALIYGEVQRLAKLGISAENAWANFKTREGLHGAVVLHRDWRKATGRTWKAGDGSVGSANGNGAGAAAPQPPAAAPVATGVTGVDGAMRSIAERNAAGGVVTGGSMPPRPAPAGKGPAHELRAALSKAGGNSLGPYPWPE